VNSENSLELPGFYVDCAWLAQNINHPDLRIIQVGGDKFYRQIHLSGAVMISYDDFTSKLDGVPGMRPDSEVLAALFGRLGITPSTKVVAYDVGGGQDAGRLIWTLATMGHHTGAVLDGGIATWYQEKRELVAIVPEIAAVEFVANHEDYWRVDLEEMQGVLAGDGNGALLLDVRSSKEYLGFEGTGPKGHIAGARHFDWVETLSGPNDARLLPRERLQEMFAARGVEDPEQEVIIYCQTAHRAAQTWALLRNMGFHKVRMYDGSIAEWGFRQNLPLVVGDQPG